MHRHVLVTGGAGFVGHHVIAHILRETEWSVTSLDRPSHAGNYRRLREVADEAIREGRLRLVWHDLRSPIPGQVAYQIDAPDTILHLAASSHVDRSIEDPAAFVLDNVLGTVHAMQYARTTGAQRFVYFSTDEVFGPAPTGVEYAEWARYKSGNPYAATKAGAEEMALAFHNTYRLPVIITHTMNVFGERQHPEKFIPSTIRNVRDSRLVHIHADATATQPGARHYIHADDVASALLFLLEMGEPGEKYNVVGPQEIDNLRLASYIAEVVGKPLHFELVDFHSSRPGHDLRYALDGTRLREMGWKAQRSVADALATTVRWTLARPEWL